MAEEEQQPGDESPKQMVLDALPSEWRETLLEEGARAGVHQSDDAMWPMVGMMVQAWAAAEKARKSADASAEAARAVSKSVDRLQQSLAQVPEQSTKAVLKAGERAAADVQKSLRGFGQEQSEAMTNALRDVIQTEFENSEKQRRQHWRQMLDEFDAKASETAEQHQRRIENGVAKSLGELAKSENRRSKLLTFWSAVLAVALGVAITSAGGAYFWQDYAHHAAFTACTHGRSGGTWCRVVQHAP